MPIYTRTGDKGTTSLFDGHRVAKDSLRVNAYGTLDELNAQLSVCEKLVHDEDVKNYLHHIQQLLFSLCAEVASQDPSKLTEVSTLIGQREITWLEHIVDTISSSLPEVHSFILSGRCLAAAEIHVGRTICRRAERLLISLGGEEALRTAVLAFINRLSDCLYMLARQEDFTVFIEEAVEKIYTVYNREVVKKGVVDMKHFDQLENLALQLCEKAKEKARELHIPAVISVVDEKGLPILFYRMEHALLVSNEIAPSKAYTAVAFKVPTHQLANNIQSGAPLYQIESMVHQKIVTFGGGYPIVKDGHIVGGFGISGGTVDEDMTIAEYALNALEVSHG